MSDFIEELITLREQAKYVGYHSLESKINKKIKTLKSRYKKSKTNTIGL